MAEPTISNRSILVFVIYVAVVTLFVLTNHTNEAMWFGVGIGVLLAFYGLIRAMVKWGH